MSDKLGFVLFMLLCACVCGGGATVIRPTSGTLSLIENEGFIAFLETPKSFGTIKNCWFKFRDETKTRLDLTSKQPITTSRGEIILPFNSSICGFRVNKVSSASAATWTLETENMYGDFEQDSLTVQILPAQKVHFDTHITKEIGKGTIPCSKHASYTKHCKLTDLGTGESWEKCEAYTTIGTNSSFECLMYNWGRIEASKENIFVDIQETKIYTKASLEENDDHLVMRCEFVDTLYTCQGIKPGLQGELLIMDGLFNGHYSSYDTLIAKGKCALEIPKPFDESEKGLWRIINFEKSSLAGCLFYVGRDKDEIIEEEIEKMDTITEIKVYEPTEGNTNGGISEISCMVPFVIDDCFLRDPNNTVYFPDAYIMQRSGQYGRCSFKNMPIIAGIWTCGMRGHDYAKEVLQDVQVTVKPKGGEVLTELLKVRKSDAVELMCVSAYEEALSHCAFIDPKGSVHLVGTLKSLKTSGHVEYYGRGLKFGECGAKINGISADDFGNWKCEFVLYSSKTVSTFKIKVTESATARATSVGLGVGITVIVILVMGVVIGTFFYRRRNQSARHDFRSSDPLDFDRAGISMETST